MHEIINTLITLNDHAWSHLNAAKGQRSTSLSLVCCFGKNEIQTDGGNNKAVTLSRVWAQHWEAPVPCTVPPPPALNSLFILGILETYFQWSNNTRDLDSKPETVMSVFTNSLAWVMWTLLCLQCEFTANHRCVPWGCSFPRGPALPKGIISLTCLMCLVDEWGRLGPWRCVRTPSSSNIKRTYVKREMSPTACPAVCQEMTGWPTSSLYSCGWNYVQLRVG